MELTASLQDQNYLLQDYAPICNQYLAENRRLWGQMGSYLVLWRYNCNHIHRAWLIFEKIPDVFNLAFGDY